MTTYPEVSVPFRIGVALHALGYLLTRCELDSGGHRPTCMYVYRMQAEEYDAVIAAMYGPAGLTVDARVMLDSFDHLYSVKRKSEASPDGTWLNYAALNDVGVGSAAIGDAIKQV